MDAELIFFRRFHDLIDDLENFQANRNATTKPTKAPSDPEVYIQDHITTYNHRATCCYIKPY